MRPKAAALIPARLGASRLPNKPLLCKNGIPLIVWVYQRAVKSNLFHQVLVVAEDQEIVDCVKAFGGQAIKSTRPCQSGSQRIAYAYLEDAKSMLDPALEYIINLQGDEPCFDYAWIEALLNALVNTQETKVNIATLVTPIDINEPNNRNRVKCSFNQQRTALYFSRQPIGFHQHIGIYGFHCRFIPMLLAPKTPLAIQEDLEQLSWMEKGESIQIVEVFSAHLSIDTEIDYLKWLQMDESSLLK